MKRITLLSMLLTLLSVTAFAQKGKNLRQLQGAIPSPSTMITKTKGISRRLQPAVNVPPLVGDQLVTPPETATSPAVCNLLSTSHRLLVTSW